MPDLIVQPMSVCVAHIGKHEVRSDTSTRIYQVEFYENGEVWCSCPGMKYHHAKNLTCKHIDRLMDEICGWREDVHGGYVTEEGRCPECGGETRTVMVGV